MSANITIGKYIPDGQIKHISEVENGDKCDCKCTECGEHLMAINNENNKREQHFRHKIDTKCGGGKESALHLLAKQIIKDNNEITISKNYIFNYSKSEIEVSLNDYQPDVIIENSNRNIKWLIEIAVTSFIDERKRKKIKRDNLNCLEIDLQEVDREIDLPSLRKIILISLKVRKIINKQRINVNKTNNNWFFYAVIIVLSGVIYANYKRESNYRTH